MNKGAFARAKIFVKFFAKVARPTIYCNVLNDMYLELENVFMKHYAPNYTLASKQNISHIKVKPKSTHIFRLFEHE